LKVDSENKHISDEVLARYLSGKATAEEETAVLDYLSESDERVEELLAMTAAIETTRQQDDETTRRRDNKTTRLRDNKTTRVRPLWPVISAAASVALLIGVGIALWHNSASNGVNIDPAPAYAEQDSIVDSLGLKGYEE
jgi:anti-sigma factor RsiW